MNNVLKSNERTKEEYPYQYGAAIKYRDLVKYSVRKRKKIRFKTIIMNIDNDDLLEFEEMKYALEHNAIIWAPAPGKQTKVYWEYRKNGGNNTKILLYNMERNGNCKNLQ